MKTPVARRRMYARSSCAPGRPLRADHDDRPRRLGPVVEDGQRLLEEPEVVEVDVEQHRDRGARTRAARSGSPRRSSPRAASAPTPRRSTRRAAPRWCGCRRSIRSRRRGSRTGGSTPRRPVGDVAHGALEERGLVVRGHDDGDRRERPRADLGEVGLGEVGDVAVAAGSSGTGLGYRPLREGETACPTMSWRSTRRRRPTRPR